MSNQPTPGWYPDPEYPGYRRWWDGSNWTDTREADPAAAAAQPAAGPSTAPFAPGAPYASPAASTGVVGRLPGMFDPDPTNPDSISKAIETVKTAFWRLLGLMSMAVGGIFLLAVIGQVLLFATLADSANPDVGFNSRTGELEFSTGPSAGQIIFAIIVGVALYAGILLLSIWVYAAMVRVVRGQQAGMHVRVGEALSQTYPRAWRLMVLGAIGFLILAILWGITAAVGSESPGLGILLGLFVLVVAIGIYTFFIGLIAWLVSPTNAETAGTS